jgi:hypothetical protein
MRIGGSLLLIALGAILKFAVHPSHNTSGIDVPVIGVILMIVGALGLLITGIMMSTRRRTDVVHQGVAGTSRTTYVTPEQPVDRTY